MMCYTDSCTHMYTRVCTSCMYTCTSCTLVYVFAFSKQNIFLAVFIYKNLLLPQSKGLLKAHFPLVQIEHLYFLFSRKKRHSKQDSKRIQSGFLCTFILYSIQNIHSPSEKNIRKLLNREEKEIEHKRQKGR